MFACLSVATLGSFIPVVNAILNPADTQQSLERFAAYLGPGESWFRSEVIVWLQPDHRIRFLAIFTGVLVFLTLLKGAAKFVVENNVGIITNSTVMRIQNDLFAHMMRMDYAFYQQTGVAQILSRFTIDVEGVYKGIKNLSGKSIYEPLRILACFLFCLTISWKLTLLSIVVVPPIAGGIVWLGNYSRRKGRQMLQAKARQVGIMQEAFQGIRVVKVFHAESHEQSAFEMENERVFRQNMKVTQAEALIGPLLELLGIVGVASVIILGCHYYVFPGRISIGTFTAFYASIIWMIDPLRKLASVNSRVQACVAGAERIFEFMDTPISITDKPGAESLSGLKDAIAFEGVSFDYGNGIPVLRDIRFTLPRGQTLAIVGMSGAGKSTLVNLVPRFYEAVSGRITIDGRDIRDFSMVSLRRLIGMVTQETLLFNDTVRNNIAYGIDGAVDEARVIAAARAAAAHEFILKLPQGYDTVIGEQGTTLSGGQRQRIAIARAMFKDPQILILDEATSSLDSENERVIQGVLQEFMKQRTTLVIAHRLSTIERADRILVLQAGEIEGFGTHSELMQTSEIYRRLYEQQFKAPSPAATPVSS